MLEIQNLFATIDGKEILKGINLKIAKGETLAVMGPNGSGKSSLSKSIMGIDDLQVTKGKMYFNKKLINDLDTDERSKLGIFLANQYPIEIPGVNLAKFLKIIYDIHNQKKLTIKEFEKYLDGKLEQIGLSKNFAQRNLNEGFSGGEKKKCEILQMAIIKPQLAIMDETDSGLDISSLKQIFQFVQKTKDENPKMSFMIITHYERIFRYIKADSIAIFEDGKVKEEGSKDLLEKILQKGF